MFRLRGLDTVRITKVKGHVDEGMVRDGGVREQDMLGNNAADGAADFGRRRVDLPVIDGRRIFSGVCSRWYPVLLDLHRFLIAISWTVVNYDGNGGTSPDPLVWSVGALPKRHRLVHAVRDHAFLPGPSSTWEGEWVTLVSALIIAAGVGAWPYSVGILVKWVAFLGSLHWPAASADLGVGSVSYVEILILYDFWPGERLVIEKAVPKVSEARAPNFSVGCAAWSRH